MRDLKRLRHQEFDETLDDNGLINAATMTNAFLHSPLVRLVESKFRFRDQNLTVRFLNTRVRRK
jgi:hypothetical protein